MPIRLKCLIEFKPLWKPCPAYHLVEGFVDQFFVRRIDQPFKCMVHLQYGQVRVEDEDAIGYRTKQRRHPQVLSSHLGVEPGIAHGNGGLVGETGQDGVIIR